MFLMILLLFLVGVCWGSFLNSIGHRLINQKKLFTLRSHCPHCTKILYAYDLIPLISWIILARQCRFCKNPIPWYYPFIELFSGIIFTLLFLRVDSTYLPAYFIFFSALIISIRTDLESFLISRYVSLFFIPVGFFFSFMHFLPISLPDSILGACTAYGCLWLVSYAYYFFTGRLGLGLGDVELLAAIGSFIGFSGWWISLSLGALLASLIGILYMLYQRQKNLLLKIPFGPFLALGAISYVLYRSILIHIFFPK